MIEKMEDMDEELCSYCELTDFGSEKINTNPNNLCEGGDGHCSKSYLSYLENMVDEDDYIKSIEDSLVHLIQVSLNTGFNLSEVHNDCIEEVYDELGVRITEDVKEMLSDIRTYNRYKELDLSGYYAEVIKDKNLDIKRLKDRVEMLERELKLEREMGIPF